jgi:4-carboxymuconolactone decarboxylase
MRIPPFRPEHLTPDQQAVYDAVTGGPRARGPQLFPLTTDDGSLRGPFNALLLAPAIGGALQELGSAIRYRGALDDRSREIAILLVAARWRSEFEQVSHEAIARSLGFDDAQLAGLAREDLRGLSDRERVVADTVRALLDGDLDDDAWRRAEHGLGAPTVFELTTLVGYYSTLALQLRVFRVGV